MTGRPDEWRLRVQPMIRIVFVDDETRILDGIRRSMYGMRGEWEMRFAESGAEALKALAAEPADVVVSDMRMAGMDGSELLGEVKRLYPEIVRFVLSGQAETESIIRVTRSAHRYLSKPCDAVTLKAAIARAMQLRALLNSNHLAAIVGSVDALPTPPKRYQELLDCLRDPEAAIADVVQILRHDIAMTVKLVKLANSGFFGNREPVQTVDRAASFVGMEAISTLVLGQELFDSKNTVALPGFDLEELGQHSFQTAAWARAIALHEGLPSAAAERAFLAGVLHDVGRLIFATRVPPADMHERERWLAETAQQMETHHATVGAYLLGLWGFPESIVEALVWHHTPSKSGETSLGLCGLVHIGNQMAHGREIEPEYLQSLGLAERVREWRELRT
jgi:HD-like signal output (HDOD) protein/CheY-like chemotaxis protein